MKTWTWFATLILTFALVAAPVPARADELIVASEPRVHQELDEPPGWVTIAFDSTVDPAYAKILVTNSKGENVTINRLIVEGTNVTTQLKDGLRRDTYTVRYRIDREDGQSQGGAFQFAYGRGNWDLPEEEKSWSGDVEEPPVMASTDPFGNPTQSVEPTPIDPTPTPSETPTPTPTASATPQVTPTVIPTAPGQPAGGGDLTLPLVLGGVVLAAAAAGGAFWWRKRQG